MKVLAINGSPHKNGTTAAALGIVADELKAQGIETEIIRLGTKPLQGCTGCGGCRKTEGNLCIYDDIVNECILKSREADGLLLATPVYYAGIAGTMKCFLDRLFFAGSDLSYKVGAAFCVLRRSGGIDVFHQLYNYMNLANMVLTPSQYWNVAHGTSGEELMEDKEGVRILRAIGRNMAWLLKVVENGKELPKPDLGPREWTNFIH